MDKTTIRMWAGFVALALLGIAACGDDDGDGTTGAGGGLGQGDAPADDSGTGENATSTDAIGVGPSPDIAACSLLQPVEIETQFSLGPIADGDDGGLSETCVWNVEEGLGSISLTVLPAIPGDSVEEGLQGRPGLVAVSSLGDEAFYNEDVSELTTHVSANLHVRSGDTLLLLNAEINDDEGKQEQMAALAELAVGRP